MRITIDQASAKQVQTALQKAVDDKSVKLLLDTVANNVTQLAHANCDAYGGKSFWKAIKRSITSKVDTSTNSVEIGATDWRATHVQFGGPISAPGKGQGSLGRKSLTIPISDKSYGKTVSSFAGQTLIKIKNILFLATAKKGGQESVIEPLFVLVKKTRPQKPRPFMPWGAEADTLVFKAADDWMRAVIQ